MRRYFVLLGAAAIIALPALLSSCNDPYAYSTPGADASTGGQPVPTSSTSPTPRPGDSPFDASAPPYVPPVAIPKDAGTPIAKCATDALETNDTISSAWSKPNEIIDSCDWQGSDLSSIASGLADEDWWYFFGRDRDSACAADPAVRVNDPRLRVCVAISCQDGGQDGAPSNGIVNCGNGYLEPASGLCCVNGTETMKIAMNCEQVTYSQAVVFMRVTALTNECIPYKLNYNF